MQPTSPEITIPLVGIPDVLVRNLEQTIEGDFVITVESGRGPLVRTAGNGLIGVMGMIT